jgi:hypothetical protein
MPDLTPDVERELAALDDALAGRRVEADLTELGELALALRETRPRPTDGFGRSLDARVERGFPGGDPRSRASGRRWWQELLTVPAFGIAAAVLVIAVIVVVGPSGSNESGAGRGTPAQGIDAGGGGGGASEGAGGAREAVPEVDRAQHGDESSGGSTSSLASPSSVPPAPRPGSPRSDRRNRRAVERSASLTLAARPRDIDAVSAKIQDVTRQQGGFVVSATVNSTRGGGGGTFELRLPTRNLDEAIAALSQLASVRERAQRSDDITAAVVSARSRLKDARTERESLLRQLADAVTVTETEAIRKRLDIVSREIERARAGVRRVNNRASFSTVAVTLVADRSAGGSGSDEDGDWTPGDAARDALRVLEVAVGVALIVLAVAVPLALLAALGWVAARWTRRRRREHALDAI